MDKAKDRIRGMALACGFDTVGFTAPALPADAPDGLKQFLQLGHHGEMGWMQDKADRRASPETIWPDARSVIVLGQNYAPARDPMEKLAAANHGNISCYAQNEDYHEVIRKKLKQLARTVMSEFPCEVKVFVDTAPVMEKPLAQQAGIGWQGKHTCIVSRQFGSWLFLGEIFTTLALPPDEAETDHCGTCTRCLDICPTQAFTGPHRIDARKCISYLTIEHKGHIGEPYRKAMGNRIYGCDDCLAVCPWNSFARTARESAYHPRAQLASPLLAELAGLDDSAFRKLFSKSPVKRIGRDRFVRNVLIAIGNSGDTTHITQVVALLKDTSPLVRAMATWALDQLSSDHFNHYRAAYGEHEGNAEVASEWQRQRG